MNEPVLVDNPLEAVFRETLKSLVHDPLGPDAYDEAIIDALDVFLVAHRAVEGIKAPMTTAEMVQVRNILDYAGSVATCLYLLMEEWLKEHGYVDPSRSDARSRE